MDYNFAIGILEIITDFPKYQKFANEKSDYIRYKLSYKLERDSHDRIVLTVLKIPEEENHSYYTQVAIATSDPDSPNKGLKHVHGLLQYERSKVAEETNTKLRQDALEKIKTLNLSSEQLKLLGLKL
jgi:hypothetical protein